MERPQTIGFPLRPQQQEILENLARFNVLICHRRFGKTVLAIWALVIKCIQDYADDGREDTRCHYFAPSYKQAKRVSWDYIKRFTADIPGTVANESELRLDFPWGARIQLGGAEDPDSHRGIYSDYAVLDEPAQMSPVMLTEVLRPALADRRGGMIMIGTPKGRHGLLFDSYMSASGSDDWSAHMYKASDTGIIPDDELQAARRMMSAPEYEQEFECSFSAAIKGAYWGAEMNRAEDEGRIGHFPHDDRQLVHTSWDLGIADAMAVWFWQVLDGIPTAIDYLEATNKALPHIVAEMGEGRRAAYRYGRHIVPHDIRQRSISTGLTRKQTLQNLGLDCLEAPNLPIEDGIDIARSRINITRFHVEHCAQGIECLRQYSAEWDDQKGVLRKVPLHNWASHGADSFRYFSLVTLNALSGQWGELDYSALDRANVTR